MIPAVSPVNPEIHLFSLTIFAQEALVTRNLYELKWYACANYLCVKTRICAYAAALGWIVTARIAFS